MKVRIKTIKKMLTVKGCMPSEGCYGGVKGPIDTFNLNMEDLLPKDRIIILKKSYRGKKWYWADCSYSIYPWMIDERLFDQLVVKGGKD